MNLNIIPPQFSQLHRENIHVAMYWWVVGSRKLIWPACGHEMQTAMIFTNIDTLSACIWGKGTMELSPRYPPLTTFVIFDALHACDIILQSEVFHSPSRRGCSNHDKTVFPRGGSTLAKMNQIAPFKLGMWRVMP
jgi:hypothetical protein